jgi:hypothetical protein
MGFEPTIPASERVKTVHTLDRWATYNAVQSVGSQNDVSEKHADSACCLLHTGLLIGLFLGPEDIYMYLRNVR